MNDRTLPFRARTATGETLDLELALHPDTVSPMRVAQLASAVLETVNREIGVLGQTGNGDVLQALALALAVRSAMIVAPRPLTDRLTRDLLERALEAAGEARRSGLPAGHA